MTKEDIKKALMTCSVDSCKDCPYDNTGLYCCGKLKRDALALITEQENEIERLKAENEQSRKPRILGYEATVEFHDDIVSEPSADCKEKEIKQAQLNILGKLWSNISNSTQLIQSHIADGSFTIYVDICEKQRMIHIMRQQRLELFLQAQKHGVI